MLYKSEDLLPHHQLHFKGMVGRGGGFQVNHLPSKKQNQEQCKGKEL